MRTLGEGGHGLENVVCCTPDPTFKTLPVVTWDGLPPQPVFSGSPGLQNKVSMDGVKSKVRSVLALSRK